LKELTGAFRPSGSNKNDSDGTTPAFSVTTRDYTTAGLRRNLVKKVRLNYELADAAADNPTITASYAGSTSPAFTALTGSGAENDGLMETTQTFPVGNVRPRFIRFKFSCSNPVARLVVKSVEVMIRPGGRQ